MTNGPGPLVTVVTPTCNPGVRRLERCVRSVREQSYRNIEHVVVDGGSIDGTLEVLRDQTALRWVSEPDRGQSDALNKGFRMARGAIVGWLNADDVLRPDAVMRAVHAFGSSSEVGWVYGSVRVTGDVPDYVLRAPRRLRRAHFFRGTPVAQPGSFFARSALDRAGPLADDLHYAMDLDLWCRFFAAGVISVRLPGPSAVFEVHGGSKSGSVPHDTFVDDQARALQRNGFDDIAAATYGRAAALRSWRGSRMDDALLQAECRRICSDLLPAHAGGLDALVADGVRAEAALLAAKAGQVRALAQLVSPHIWRRQACRQRVTAAATVAASRLRHRVSPGRAG